MFKSSFSPLKIFAGVGAVLLVMLVMMAIAFQRFSELTNANQWNVHTYQVLLSTSHIMRGLVNIQAGSRGFLQTGDEQFLQPYFQGRKEFAENHARALELTRDNSEQQKRLRLLQRQYDIWMRGHIEPLIKMRRSVANDQEALRRAAPGVRQRKVIADTLRKTIATIEGEEMRLLAERTQREQSQQSLARVTLLYNGGFAVILAGGLSFLLAGNTRKMELLNTRLNEQIDRRKKAEKEAAVLNKHNQMLLEATHEGIAGVNQSGRITFFNPSAEQITGYSAAEAIGKSLHELVHSKRPDGTRYPVEECPIMLALRDGKAHSGDDEVFIRKDGKQVPVDFTTAPLIEDTYAEETKRHGAVVVFRDITRRKREEATRDEIAAIITHANDAIISFSLEGVVTSWNRAATRIYGFAEHEMVGQYMDKLLPPNQTDELPALVEKIKNNEAVPGYVTTRIRKDGERIRVLFLLSPIKDRSGRVTGVSSISYEAKRTEIGNSGPVASVIESVVKSSGAKSVVSPN